MTQSTKTFSADAGESSRTWWLLSWEKLSLVLLTDMNGKYLKYYQLLIATLRSFDKLPGTKCGFSNQLRQFEYFRTSDIESHGHLDPEGRLSWSWSPCRIRKGILKSSRCSTAQSMLFITTCFHLCQVHRKYFKNLGSTKFVSTTIKEGVVFYVALPRFWVGNLLNVKSEMRWVGFTE